MATLNRRRPETLSPIERWLTSLDPRIDRAEAITAFMGAQTAGEREALQYAFTSLWARPDQLLPDGEWDVLMVRAGRGFGKTRSGSEGVRRLVNDGAARSVTIIGTTAAEVRDSMIEGESGLLTVHPPDVRPTYEPSKRLVTWPNGAVAHLRSAEEPDSIRSLNSDLVWADEPASWKAGSAPWDMAMLGNRIGRPHAILTGTPRPLPWLRDIEKASGTVLRRGSTYDNIGNLAPQFIRLVLDRYEGTRLGRQELHAEYLDDVEGALWTMLTIEATRIMQWDPSNPWGSLIAATDLPHRAPLGLGAWQPAAHERRPWATWVGVDPPAETAQCGIVIATAPAHGRASADHCVVLDDMSTDGPPEVWGARVVEAVRKWNAVGAVVERNQGGDMVRATIHAVDPNVKVEKVTATESKYDRAEPVAVLMAKGWIHHYGHLPALETLMSTWVAGEGKSPDPLDAMVHVVTKLLTIRPTRGGSKVHSPVART